jgi:hypothetical protein
MEYNVIYSSVLYSLISSSVRKVCSSVITDERLDVSYSGWFSCCQPAWVGGALLS